MNDQNYQVEIIGPSGAVHYRRPISHEMVRDALKTPDYAVRWPGCRDMRKLDDLPQNCKATVTFPAEGMTAACPVDEPGCKNLMCEAPYEGPCYHCEKAMGA